MCNIQSPNTRALIIEVLENGKVSLPPVIHQPEHTLTIDELKKCRDYLDLIINNPNNFHIVRKKIPFTENIGGCLMCMGEFDNKMQAQIGVCGKCIEATLPAGAMTMPDCKSCGNSLADHSFTEIQNKLCFKCEKKQILKASDPNRRGVGNYVEQLKSTLTSAQKELIDGCPRIIVNIEDDIAKPAITQNDDKICDWPGCDKVLNKLIRPNSWAKGHCLYHDGKKGVKIQKSKKEQVVNLHHCSKCSLVLISQREIDSMLCIHCNGNFNFDSDPSAI